jgi:NADH-quinone oxidoreductase chain G
MLKITINNKIIYVKPQTTILQACEKINIHIPRFCYNEKLGIAGNCRMCLVEVEKSLKPVVSCAFPVMNNMVIYTDTPLVKKARENVIEFLLINHPLDCPICDQGGECDLQDQTLHYGSDKSRFYEYKRSVEDKNCGPLIKTIMTRCIHCTRCVRFMEEMTNFNSLGMVGRGNQSEISTYLKKQYLTELSGNIIDLCPVGALTSKPYAFKARPWELESMNNLDISDAIGSNIVVNSRGLDILRIIPKLNEQINETWISDKTRFSFDSLQNQRLTHCFIKNDNNIYNKVTWKFVFNLIKDKIQMINSKNIAIFYGDLIDLRTSVILKKLSNSLGITNVSYQKTNLNLNNDFLSDFTFKENYNSINNVDVCLIVSTNPRYETSMYNLKLLNQVKKGKLIVGLIGPKKDLIFPYTHLGNNINALIKISEGSHSFCKTLKQSKKPLILYGTSILQRKDFKLFKSIINNISKNLNNNLHSINLIHTNVGTLNGSIVNLKPSTPSSFICKKKMNNFKLCFFIGVSNIDFNLSKDTFVIYQGSFGNKLASKANLLLPSTAHFEKNAEYLNLEGRIQKSYKVLKFITDLKDDWKILAYIFFNLTNKKNLNLNFFIKTLIPNFFNYNTKFNLVYNPLNKFDLFKNQYNKFFLTNLKTNVKNFYKTNEISKNSILMTKSSKILLIKKNFINKL